MTRNDYLHVDIANFGQTLRDYQEETVVEALEFVERGEDASYTGTRRKLWALPTGTGKGSLQLELLRRLNTRYGPAAQIVTPSLEVVRGYLERCGATEKDLCASESRLCALGERIGVTTPVRLRNRILTGEAVMPEVIIIDEGHHSVEDNVVTGTLSAVGGETTCWLGFTATPYRGTPKSTAALREMWGQPRVVLTIPEAAARGYIVMPKFHVVPFIDDDQIVVSNGEFQTKASGTAVVNHAEIIAGFVACDLDWRNDPTVLVVPNTEAARHVAAVLERAHDVPAHVIVAATSAKKRAEFYADCRAGRAVLVTVGVLNEGVDLPWLMNVVDARPTTSPVTFVQRVGRAMRIKPDGRRPNYYSLCRNLERFSYTLQGGVPREAVRAAQEAFESPSARAAVRSVGWERLGRFKQTPVPLLDGVTATMHTLASVDENGVRTDFVTLLDPCSEDVAVFTRTVKPATFDWRTKRSTREPSDWGKWELTTLPTDFAGFATSKDYNDLTERQAAWWGRCAADFGLDPNADITSRQFQILPVLNDTGLTLAKGS